MKHLQPLDMGRSGVISDRADWYSRASFLVERPHLLFGREFNSPGPWGALFLTR